VTNYAFPLVILRTLSFPGIKTCEPTDELRQVIKLTKETCHRLLFGCGMPVSLVPSLVVVTDGQFFKLFLRYSKLNEAL
jgi:hypothetical protein